MRYFLSLSPSFLFFPPFFPSFSPIQIRRNCLLKTENWTGTLAIFHTCRAITPRSVAVRTIIAGWIIAESNNKRSWGPQFPTGPFLCHLTVQRQLWVIRLSSLPVSRATVIRKRRRSVSRIEIRANISFFREKREKIVVELCALINYICASNTIIKNT